MFYVFAETCGFGPRQQRYRGEYRILRDAEEAGKAGVAEGADYYLVFRMGKKAASGRLVRDSRIPGRDPQKAEYRFGIPVLMDCGLPGVAKAGAF